MNSKKFNSILYFISATILTTIAVQFYWNYKNYQQHRQRVMNEIQVSLDNAVEQYFSDLSKQNHFSIVTNPKDSTVINLGDENSFSFHTFSNDGKNNKKVKKKLYNIARTALNKIEVKPIKSKQPQITTHTSRKCENCDCTRSSDHKEYLKNFTGKLCDFCKVNTKHDHQQFTYTYKDVAEGMEMHLFQGKKAADSLNLIQGLKTIYIALQSDTINHQKINTILQKELAKKDIKVEYTFEYYSDGDLQTDFNSGNINVFKTIASKSTFLGPDKQFKMKYSNPTKETLKRSSTGILLSLLLSLAVISSLFYLLKIIQQQKQLAEIKNDLISNITHEFKTPITTVSTALEAITSFNVVQDVEKTKKYVAISEHQIKKLHLMVEKLLETATLDSEKLLLKEEPIDIIHLLEKLSNKHQLFTTEKVIHFSSNIETLIIQIDPFHLENAISNLLDNAIKYGGNIIKLACKNNNKEIEISVSDNGLGIDKNQQEKIFDKFYRVPKGNTHDVKGFGIGLYYTKKIIEKHKGTILLTSTPEATTFKILLPHE